MKNLSVLLPAFMAAVTLSSCGSMNDLTTAIADPDHVTTLKIRYFAIDSLPKEIGKLKNLKKLVLFKNNLRYIPEEIGQLKNLEKLVISSNLLTSLPASIGQLEKLRELSLKHNKLTTLPETIGNLKNLESLYVEYNDLKSLPAGIGKLENLQFLSINNNQLTRLPKETGRLERLRFFVIGKNSLTELPAEIGGLTGLIELNVAYSGPMLTIPETIQNCKSLEFLYVDKSTILPYSIGSVNTRLQVVIKERGELN